MVWGEHPGPGTPADVDLGFPRIRVTVQPAPFDDHARNMSGATRNANLLADHWLAVAAQEPVND